MSGETLLTTYESEQEKKENRLVMNHFRRSFKTVQFVCSAVWFN